MEEKTKKRALTGTESAKNPAAGAVTGGMVSGVVPRIVVPGTELAEAARRKIDGKTKPVGSLGLLEGVARRMCVIQRSLDPVADEKAVLVFATDHGVTQEGVSAYPSDVTPQMVLNFLHGGAAINAFCRHGGIDLDVVDVGVAYDFGDVEGLIDKKIAHGTRNLAVEPAMTGEEAVRSLEAGIEAYREIADRKRYHLIGLGEMGIGNTTAASAVVAAATGVPVAGVVGRGTGVDDEGLRRKIRVIERALDLHRPDATDGVDLLSKVGGFEIGAMAGAALAAAADGVAVVLDGLISVAGGLIAWTIAPTSAEYFFAGHRSVEVGQSKALDTMGLTPLLDLEFRLGEGTGAALAMHLIGAACAMVREMASFEEAGVSEKE